MTGNRKETGKRKGTVPTSPWPCPTRGYIAVVPLQARVGGDAPRPRFPVRVPAVVPDQPLQGVGDGRYGVDVGRHRGPGLAGAAGHRLGLQAAVAVAFITGTLLNFFVAHT